MFISLYIYIQCAPYSEQHPIFLSESGAPCMLIECLQRTAYIGRNPKIVHASSEGLRTHAPLSLSPQSAKCGYVATKAILSLNATQPNVL